MTHAQITFVNEDAHAEGSYTALCRVYGMEFAVHYVSGEIRVYGTGGQKNRRAWQVNGAAALVREEVGRRIVALGDAFALAHSNLYAEEAA